MGLRKEYCRLLDQDRLRCERNDYIMRNLSFIESRASALTAKTDRLRQLRHHYETYLNRNYPCWKKESNRLQRTTDHELSNHLHSSAQSLSQFSTSPSITRKNSLVVPDSQLSEYSKYKFASEWSIASPSLKKFSSEWNISSPSLRKFASEWDITSPLLTPRHSPRKRENYEIDKILSRSRSYTDVSSDSTNDTSSLLKNEHISTNLLGPSFSSDNLSHRLPNNKENINSTNAKSFGRNNYRSKSVCDARDRNPPFRTVQRDGVRPIPSYKPLMRSRSLHVNSRPSSSNLMPEHKSELRRPSNLYQSSYSVHSDSRFSSSSVNRLASSNISRSVSPRPEYLRSKQNPLQIVDDIFKKYLINYDKRYLCDPISESKYGKYLYPSRHRENNFKAFDNQSPSYNMTSRLPDLNFSYAKDTSYSPIRDFIDTNRYDSYGSNKSLYDSNYTCNRCRGINLDSYSNRNDWTEWSYYRDRYKYSPELDIKYSRNQFNYPDNYRSGSKFYSWNDVKESSSDIFLDRTASRFTEPSRIDAHQRSTLPKSSLDEDIFLDSTAPRLTRRLSTLPTKSTLDENILTTNDNDKWNYGTLSEPEKDSVYSYKVSTKPPTTPKKVSFSNNNLDYDKTVTDEYLGIGKDVRQTSRDNLTLSNQDTDEFNYKSYGSQDTMSDNNYYNSEPRGLETSMNSTNIYDDNKSYKTPLQRGGENDSKGTPLSSVEDLMADKGDIPNKKNDATKYNQKIKDEEGRNVPNPMESTKFIMYPSEEALNSDVHKTVDGKVDDGILEKDGTSQQPNELTGGYDISAKQYAPNEQATHEYNYDEHKQPGDFNEYKEVTYTQDNKASYGDYTIQNPSKDEHYFEDKNLEQHNETSNEYNKPLPAEYQQVTSSNYKQPNTSEQYRPKDVPQEYQQIEQYSTEHGNEYQQPTDYKHSEYDQQNIQGDQRSIEYADNSFQQSSMQDQNSKPSEAFQANQQTPAQSVRYDGNSYPNDHTLGEHNGVMYGQQKIPDQQTMYNDYVQNQTISPGFEDTQARYEQNAQDVQRTSSEPYPDDNYVQDNQVSGGHNVESYGQQNIPEEQINYDAYIQDQKQSSGNEDSYREQDAQPVYDQSAQDTQQIPTEYYQSDKYPQNQELQSHNVETYGQKNIPDQQTTYQDYIQDKIQPSGFESGYKQQDAQPVYDQSAQDINQIPTEYYHGDNYPQNQQPESQNVESYGQQNIPDQGTTYEGYTQDQNQPSGFQDSYRQHDPQPVYNQSAQDVQQIPTENYPGNNYVQDNQEQEGYNVRTYGQQNIPEQQIGYDGYAQDPNQLSGFEGSYKQDPQVGYEQSVQDVQQMPMEPYQGENYTQDQYEHEYVRGSQEYLPDQYQNQPLGQEYQQHPQYEGEYQADAMQAQQYQEDQTQGQQYGADYDTSYQNNPDYQYQQENTTYDQSKPEQYQYDQSGEQYQQQYEGGEQYGNNYGYDNQGQAQAYTEAQRYTQEQDYAVNPVGDTNVQQPYQEVVSGGSPYDPQYTEGYPEQTQIGSSHNPDTAANVEGPTQSEITAPVESEPPTVSTAE